MSEANERLIATFFHASRAASKRKDSPAVEKIYEAMVARAKAEALPTNPARS